MPGNSLGTTPISRSPSQIPNNLKPKIPPVFTWPVGKPSLRGFVGTESTPHSPLDNGTDNDAAGMEAPSDTEGLQVMAIAHTEENETLQHVSRDIVAQLRRKSSYNEGKLYRDVSTCLMLQVEATIAAALKDKTSSLEAPNIAMQTQPSPDGREDGWQTLMQRSFNSLCAIFEFFLPLGYLCEISDKYWGALNGLFMVSFAGPANFRKGIYLNVSCTRQFPNCALRQKQGSGMKPLRSTSLLTYPAVDMRSCAMRKISNF